MADEKKSDYTNCEKCGERILKGDVRHMSNGDDVCEYCADSYDDDVYID